MLGANMPAIQEQPGLALQIYVLVLISVTG